MPSKISKHLFVFIVLGICIGILIKLFVFEVLTVKGSSMEPSLSEGDRIVLDKLSYGIARPFGDSLLCSWKKPRPGQVIAYEYKNRLVIKRCIAVGPVPLDYSIDSGYTLTVGQQKIPLTQEQYHKMYLSREVPEGMVLAVGDNYSSSIDSRNYGFVPVKNVLGRVLGK